MLGSLRWLTSKQAHLISFMRKEPGGNKDQRENPETPVTWSLSTGRARLRWERAFVPIFEYGRLIPPSGGGERGLEDVH